MAKINLTNINKTYYSDDGRPKKVLSDFSLSIHNSNFITLFGPNACGKTTLLNLIAGIIKPDSGQIELDIGYIHQARIGYVWQDYRASLLPWLNAGENITFPLRVEGVSKQERRQVAQKILSEFNLQINRQQKVYQLSGGQQQLLSLLRSTAIKPDLILLDEPFSALDQANRWSMAFRIEQVWLKLKVPVLFVSHDIDEAILLADQVLLMSKNGQIRQTIQNQLPRPRNIAMLTSPEHIHYREKIIKFLEHEGVIKNK